MRNLFIDRIKELNPKTALDIGCGCGEFTLEIAGYCGHITAIDSSEALITRSKKEHQKPNINYIKMDGMKLDFPDNHFDLVYERSSLHHIRDWKKAANEMIRSTKKYVFLAENHDDPRSKEKQNTIYFNKVFLELQREAGYEHYPHLKPVVLENFLHMHDIKFESFIARHEESIPFKEYADLYTTFVAKTTRKKYWLDKLDEVRRDINNENLCEHDMLYLFGEKE